MIKSRAAARIFAATSALAFLASCGGGGGSSNSSTGTTPPVSTAPRFTSNATASVVENTADSFYTATATDPQGDAITFSVYAGADAGAFVINGDGELRFNEAPNYDLPSDANDDNTFEVTLRATAGGEIADLPMRITVTNDPEGIIVKRVATGIDDPVAVAQIVGQPTLLIAERSGRVLRFNQDDNSISEDIFIRDNKLPGEILAITYAFPNSPFQEGVYMVTHSPTDGLLVQAFNQDRSAFSSVRLGDPWTARTTVSIIYQPKVMIAIGSPSEADAQDSSEPYGKLLELEFYDPYAGASLPSPNEVVIRPTTIGDGIHQPGGFSLAGEFSYLADRGSTREHEVTIFRPDWRPLDFGWPFYEGSQATRENAPAAINGPTLVYPVGDGDREGQGIIAGQLFRASFDAAFGDSYVFFDTNGTVFSIPLSILNDGFRHSVNEFEDKTEDFVPDQGEIGRLVGYGAGIASTFFYLLDSDGQLFEISQEADWSE